MKKSNEYLQEFAESRHEAYQSEHTIKSYLSDIKQFFAWLDKDKKLEDMKRSDIDRYKEFLSNKKLAADTVNHKLIGLRAYIQFLNNLDDANFKITVDIRLHKINRVVYLNERLAKSDYDRLLKQMILKEDKISVAMAETMYKTGARVSEMLQLKVSDVGKDYITITGKGNKVGDLIVPSSLQERLEDWLIVRKCKYPENQYLFNNGRGSNLSRQRVYDIFRRYARLAKVKYSKVSPHALRHLYCFNLVAKGTPLNRVKELARHSHMDITSIYARPTRKELRAEVEDKL